MEKIATMKMTDSKQNSSGRAERKLLYGLTNNGLYSCWFNNITKKITSLKLVNKNSN